MKNFFLVMIVLHVLMEGLVGLGLAFAPDLLTPDLAIEHLALFINYGCAGVAIAIAVAWFWPHRDNPVVLGIMLGILATFHTAETVAGILIAMRDGGIQVIISHGLFAVCFWILWIKRNTLAQSSQSR